MRPVNLLTRLRKGKDRILKGKKGESQPDHGEIDNSDSRSSCERVEEVGKWIVRKRLPNGQLKHMCTLQHKPTDKDLRPHGPGVYSVQTVSRGKFSKAERIEIAEEMVETNEHDSSVVVPSRYGRQSSLTGSKEYGVVPQAPPPSPPTEQRPAGGRPSREARSGASESSWTGSSSESQQTKSPNTEKPRSARVVGQTRTFPSKRRAETPGSRTEEIQVLADKIVANLRQLSGKGSESKNGTLKDAVRTSRTKSERKNIRSDTRQVSQSNDILESEEGGVRDVNPGGRTPREDRIEATRGDSQTQTSSGVGGDSPGFPRVSDDARQTSRTPSESRGQDQNRSREHWAATQEGMNIICAKCKRTICSQRELEYYEDEIVVCEFCDQYYHPDCHPKHVCRESETCYHCDERVPKTHVFREDYCMRSFCSARCRDKCYEEMNDDPGCQGCGARTDVEEEEDVEENVEEEEEEEEEESDQDENDEGGLHCRECGISIENDDRTNIICMYCEVEDSFCSRRCFNRYHRRKGWDHEGITFGEYDDLPEEPSRKGKVFLIRKGSKVRVRIG